MIPIYILATTLLALCSFIAWKITQNTQKSDPRLQADLDRRIQEIGELRNQIEQLKNEKNELSINGKSTYTQLKNLESEFKAMQKERDSLAVKTAKFEEKEEQTQKQTQEMVSKQDAVRQTLEDEKQRIRNEDEKRKKHELEQRDRMWAEHENNVNVLLKDICKNPQYGFKFFDNTNLPEGFDGSLKPDFMVEFLEQYIIFDAKVSRSQSIQNYISNAVKTTAKKIKNNPKIYPNVFLVVPTNAIEELQKTTYFEQGFNFFIVSPESLEPIIASLKKITTYELAEQFDPQERENIISWIAKIDFHLNARNSFDIMLAEMGAELLADSQKQNPKLAKEVEQRKEKMPIPTIKPSEMKKLVSNMLARQEKIGDLTDPKPSIERKKLLLKNHPR